jgi:hypothetical protein
MKDTGTYFVKVNTQITYLGKPDDIKDVKDTIIEMAKKDVSFKYYVKIEDRL